MTPRIHEIGPMRIDGVRLLFVLWCLVAHVVILDITAVAALAVVQVAFASAVVTGDFKDIENEFHVGEVVTALSVSLMVVGFGLGPLCWSPLVSFLDIA